MSDKEKKSDSETLSPDPYSMDIVKTSAKNALLPGIVENYIKQKIAAAQQQRSLPPANNPEKKSALRQNPELVTGNSQKIEITDYKKYYQEALDEFIAQIRKNPEKADAAHLVFMEFIENLDKCFCWANFVEDGDGAVRIAEGAASDDTIGVCSVIPATKAREQNFMDLIEVIQGDTYPHIMIQEQPISKKWAAIALLRKLMQVYAHSILAADMRNPQRRHAASFNVTITSMVNLVDFHDNGRRFQHALEKILVRRKIKTIKQLAELIANKDLLTDEVRNLDLILSSKSPCLSKIELEQRMAFFIDSLRAMFIIGVKKGLAGDFSPDETLLLYDQFETEISKALQANKKRK